MAEDPEENNLTKLNVQKNKLELHIPKFKSLVSELGKTSNQDTDEKEFQELDKMKDDAQMALIELKNKIYVLNHELEGKHCNLQCLSKFGESQLDQNCLSQGLGLSRLHQPFSQVS